MSCASGPKQFSQNARAYCFTGNISRNKLSCPREFLVFEVVGWNDFHHGVTEQKWVVAVVKTPPHFVQTGRQMLCRETTPRSTNPRLRSKKADSTVLVWMSPRFVDRDSSW